MTRIEAATGQWSLPGGRHSRRLARPDARQRFFGCTVRWLRFLGLLEELHTRQHAHAGEVALFAAQMRDERGWSEDTIRGCCHTVDRFFDWLDERGVALASVRGSDIDRAVARYHARGHSRVTIHDYAQRLRTFFRFAEQQGWCTPGLAEGVLPSRFHRGETIPKGLNRDEVLRLLATTEGDRPADVRDRAVLMVLITYGLRAGEAAGLRLDDLDWEEETLRVRCPKPGRTHLYPLSRGFCEHVGGNVECDAVGEAQAVSYLAGNGPFTRSRANNYGALAGFWRYAISRGYATRSPLPAPEDEPRQPRSAPPYVYSRDELQRLFAAIDIRWQRPVQLDRDTLRALLLLLYGAGLRFGEAQRLMLRDVNLTDALLTVRDTKFYKNRLGPVAPQLAVALRAYAVKRAERPLPQGMDSTFLANRDGTSLVKGTVRTAFAKLLQAAGSERRDDGRRGPCLHSLRHTAAVNRLTAWYRRGADVHDNQVKVMALNADEFIRRFLLHVLPRNFPAAPLRIARQSGTCSKARPAPSPARSTRPQTP